jgi:hypothetical protein
MLDRTDEFLAAPPDAARLLLSHLDISELESLLTGASSAVANRFLEAADSKQLNTAFMSVNPDLLREIVSLASAAAIGRLVKSLPQQHLSRLLMGADDAFVYRLVSVAPTRHQKDAILKALPGETRDEWRKRLTHLENQSREARQLADQAESTLFEDRRRMLADLDRALRAKEEALRAFDEQTRVKQEQAELALAIAARELEGTKARVGEYEAAITKREEELRKKVDEFEEINRRQVQQRIEAKVPEFVAAAIKALEEREAHYRRRATNWSVHGTVVLAIAIIAATVISLVGVGIGTDLGKLPWQTLVFVSFKGLVVLGVLGLWAKHAFTVSNAYMHEAIKRSDRVHAISFGKLFLEIYGNKIERKELVDIFENWNIAGESAFQKAAPSGFEPQILDKISDLVRASHDTK